MQSTEPSPASLFPSCPTSLPACCLRVGVQVFNQASKRESLVLVCNPPEPDLRPHSLAQLIVGQRFYVDWPFLKVLLPILVNARH